MSIVDRLPEEFEEESEEISIAERVAKDTVPGLSNEEFIDLLSVSDNVVKQVINDLNNWFEIVQVHSFRERKIGIVMRYRWTIKRWVQNDMDDWLIDRGWELLPHLKADSRDHKENEMEARYRKEFNGVMVYVNLYVQITNDVFEALQKTGATEKVSKRKKTAEDILKKKRSS